VLRVLSLDGGTPADVCLVAAPPLGAAWTSTGTIVLGSIDGSGLLTVPATGGIPQPVGSSRSGGIEAWPDALPDGTSVLYTMMPAAGRPAYVAVVSLATGERKQLFEGSAARYLPSGHLVYLAGSSLMAVRFDLQRLEVTGTAVSLQGDVQQDENTLAAQFTVSPTGNLAYVSRIPRNVRNLVLVDRQGQAVPVAPPARTYNNPRVSPDGQRIVVDVQGASGPDIWIYDVSRATWSQLTFNGASNAPIWTPDGERITFINASDGAQELYWKNADGTGVDELLSAEGGNPHSWSGDGRLLARVIAGVSGNFGSQLALLSLDDGRRTRPFPSAREGTEMNAPAIDPSGRFIAYVANDSGRREIYVRPFPQGEGRWLVSDAGGIQPMWSRDGRELFYRNGNRMMAVSVSTVPVFRADAPRLLFEGDFLAPAIRANYDVMPDGKRFVMVKSAEQTLLNKQLNVVINWQQELNRRLPRN
jgi:serine/threonine-protein kinase